MRTFLNIICVALSIYYVFAAPTHAPTDTRILVKEIIGELNKLKPDASTDILTPALYRMDETNVTIEELSCRAQDSFRTIKSNFTDVLKQLLKKFNRVRKVACTTFRRETTEIDEQDLRTAIERLLAEFQKHNYSSSFVSISKSD